MGSDWAKLESVGTQMLTLREDKSVLQLFYNACDKLLLKAFPCMRMGAWERRRDSSISDAYQFIYGHHLWMLRQ